MGSDITAGTSIVPNRRNSIHNHNNMFTNTQTYSKADTLDFLIYRIDLRLFLFYSVGTVFTNFYRFD